jgi:hypothetical protein
MPLTKGKKASISRQEEALQRSIPLIDFRFCSRNGPLHLVRRSADHFLAFAVEEPFGEPSAYHGTPGLARRIEECPGPNGRPGPRRGCFAAAFAALYSKWQSVMADPNASCG